MARGRAIVLGRRIATVLGVLGAAGVLAVATTSSTAAASLARADASYGTHTLRAVLASPHLGGAVLVGFDQGLSPAARAQLMRKVGARVVKRFLTGAVLLRVPNGRVGATITALEKSGHVRYAEPDYISHESAVRIPNDPSFGQQWAFQNTGQNVGGSVGTPGADESAAAAWSVTTGSRSIVVAEVDTGVDYTHPDLAANIWSNPGGVGGCPAGTHGYNVLNSTCNPMDDDTSYNGHGTHVAGIIGAVGNNGTGVTGVNWTTTILPVKWLDSTGSGTTSGLLSALDWVLQAQAAGVNVRVVNDSATWKGTAYSQAVSDEIDLLGQHNILFVSAAGNTGDNNDVLSLRRYPCGYDRPTEICVTASDQNDTLPSWANYGPNTVDLAAPGNHIYSTLRNGTYGLISGGSMAAPQVAGAAALILSTGSYSATALKAQILNNVDPLPSLHGLVRTGGRLDICKAIPGCSSGTPPPAAPVNTALPAISGTAQAGQTLTASTGSWQGSPTSYAYQWLRCTSSCTAIGGATSASYQATSADVGATLEVAVTATNAGGSTSATSNATAAVQPAPSGSGTFGTTTVGVSSDTMAPDRKRVNRYQLAVAGSVSKLSIYLQPTGTSGTQVMKGVLYADANGAPGTLLGVSNQLSFSSTQQAGWYDLVFPSPIALGAGSYWIGMISGATSQVAGFRYTWVTGSRDYNANTYTSGPSNPFGTPTVDGELMSIYATYGSSGGTPSAPTNTTLPAISGTAQAGQTLTASTGTWQGSPTSYAYQWLRCTSSCTAIGGATSASYQATSTDVGATLEVTVTATNTGGSTSATSNPTGTVQAASGGGGGGGGPTTPVLDSFNRANGALGPNWGVVFGGFTSMQVSNQQAVDTTSKYAWNFWQQTFGPDSEVYATLATTSSDAVRVCARFTTPTTSSRSGYCLHVAGSSWNLVRIDNGSSTTLTTTTHAVAAGDRIALTVTGTTLTGWYAAGPGGAWSSVLTTTDAKYAAAGYLAVETRGAHIDDFGGGTAGTAGGVPPVPGAPVNTVAPAISGTAQAGQTLTASTGTWQGSPTSYAYQWLRCTSSCTAIGGATSASYQATSTDVGATLEVTVTATNTGGSTSATSNPTGTVQAASGGGGGGGGPTTPVLDSFNRANGSAGGNWALIRPTSFAAMNVSGNAAVDSSRTAYAWNYWKPAVFGPDCEAYVTVVVPGSDTIRIGCRVTGGGTTSYNGYYVSISGTGAWSILRVTGSSPTTLTSGATQALAAGDQVAIRVVGSVVTALYGHNNGWTQLLSYDTAGDSTRYTAAGNLALEFRNATVDDFGGGTA